GTHVANAAVEQGHQTNAGIHRLEIPDVTVGDRGHRLGGSCRGTISVTARSITARPAARTDLGRIEVRYPQQSRAGVYGVAPQPLALLGGIRVGVVTDRILLAKGYGV